MLFAPSLPGSEVVLGFPRTGGLSGVIFRYAQARPESMVTCVADAFCTGHGWNVKYYRVIAGHLKIADSNRVSCLFSSILTLY